ncbi:AAA family ATPase [Agrobacterium sp. MCAB5]|uniref:AAA family ATPase n=1 Tax=Agrobacterium sp. MCAB5 TaxID=3233042 RepID=UPI003F8EDE10
MYAKSLHIYDFKCFRKAELRLQYPGRSGEGVSELGNVNLILGDNGGGKSSVLRALAIAVLAPALLDSGFVPYRLVRRVKPGDTQVEKAFLKVEGMPEKNEILPNVSRRKKLELIARIQTRGRGNLDRLHLESTPDSPISEILFDDYSPAYFVVGYGATRRVENGEFSPSSAQRSRALRYQRIAGLFEDHVALRPMQAWLPRLLSKDPKQYELVLSHINKVLPSNIRFSGARDDEEEQYLFEFEGVPTPFSALSDGYKAFVGWVCDLIGHMADVATDGRSIAELPGIVLVDEIDLHLHPEWQRSVVPALAGAFPKIQFVFTSHSPLVASTVRRENVFVTDVAEDGTATIKQLLERVYGLGAEQLLLSSYFGLQSTRPESFNRQAETLFEKAAKGDASAALTYLDQLTVPSDSAPATPTKRNGAK